ncbi:MAG: YdcF family protein [Planctomycetales bacterium]|nr:YdcF family protein [Planctomycetales bacterium]
MNSETDCQPTSDVRLLPARDAQAARSALRRDALILFLIAGIWLGGCWMSYGFYMVEKILTRLLTPCGLTWLALLFLWRYIRATGLVWPARAAMLLFFFYWTTANTYTGNLVAGILEGRYAPIDPAKVEPFDVVVVLGGATQSDPQGNVWLGFTGDRVALAARLYHHGKVRKLVTTGVVQEWTTEAVNMSDATERIWRDLGVEAEDIVKIGGRNTTEELQNVRELLGDQPPPRVGLLTSAFHLPRAERLARQNHVSVIPIPAARMSTNDDPLPLAVIPYHAGVMLMDVSVKEFLAALIRR